MQRAVQVKIRLQEDPWTLQLREIWMNEKYQQQRRLEDSSKPIREPAKSLLCSRAGHCPCSISATNSRHLSTTNICLFTLLLHNGQLAMVHLLHFLSFGHKNRVFVKQQRHRLEPPCSQKSGMEGSLHPPVTALSLFITLQGFTCENKAQLSSNKDYGASLFLSNMFLSRLF